MSKEREVAVGAGAASASGANPVSRRAFAIGIGSTVALLGLGSLKLVPAEACVRPPGGQDEDALLAKCNHCGRCVGACPFGLIAPQSLDMGLVGMRLPYLRFSRNTPGVVDALKYCDFCAKANGGMPKCVEVCPTAALSLDAGVTADTYVLGVAELDPQLCMAYRSGYCAYCHDACEAVRGDKKAIYYVGSETDASRLPVVDTSLCNGCGACESVCVSVQDGSTRDIKERAIVVRPLSGR